MLLNIALHGMEQAAGVRYLTSRSHGGETVAGAPVLVRYADDLVALCHTRLEAERVKARLGEWLAPRGLVFNEAKTRIVNVDDGFDFLGFNVRRYSSGKLLIKPSKDAVKRIRSRLRAEVRALYGANAEALLRKINPIVRGWSAYYRNAVSKEVFSSLDSYMWTLTSRWAMRMHSNKSKHWVMARYFGRFNAARADRWVFGDRDSGAYLLKFAWTKIVRHRLVNGWASPDDPDLISYWAERRRRSRPLLPVDSSTLRLLQTQQGRCPLCSQLLLHAERSPQSPREWEQWLRTTRRAVKRQQIALGARNRTDAVQVRLVHASCHFSSAVHTKCQQFREPSGLA